MKNVHPTIQQSLKPFAPKECDGFRTSDCCSAGGMDTDIGICPRCKEHCETQCFYCEEKCELYKTVS